MAAVITPSQEKEAALGSDSPHELLTETTAKTSAPAWKRHLSAGKHWLQHSTPGAYVVALLVVAIIVACGAAALIGYQNPISDLDAKYFLSGTALSGGIVINGFFTDINPLTYTATLQVSLSGNGSYTDEEGYLAFNTDLFAESNRLPILNYNYTVGTYDMQQTAKLNVPLTGSSRAFGDSVRAQNRPTSVNYPFDKYVAYVGFAARRNDTGAAVTFTQSEIFGNIQGWATSYVQHNTSFASPVFVTEDAVYFTFTFERAGAIIAFTLVMAIVMWLTTLLVVWLTVLGIVFGWNLPINFAVVPATVLFALPGIRGLMPAVPAFGTYLDMVTILLCEALIALCFVAFNINYVFRSSLPKFPEKGKEKKSA